MQEKITIDLPEGVQLPSGINVDQNILRYALAGVLYAKGLHSGKEAREITGDSRRKFEETMNELGFCLMPSREKDIDSELNA